jgi:hypothetical protein
MIVGDTEVRLQVASAPKRGLFRLSGPAVHGVWPILNIISSFTTAGSGRLVAVE